MDVKKEIFADGVGQIHFAGSMVRFDFVTLQPTGEGTAPVPQDALRVIMPPEGFLKAFTSMQQMMDRMVEAGFLQKTETPAASPVNVPAPEAAPKAKTRGRGRKKTTEK